MINNIALLSQNVLFKDLTAFWWKQQLGLRKSSKSSPHLGRILLKRSLFTHCEAFDFQVRIARLRKHWCRHSTNFSNCGSACKHCTCWQPRCHNEFLLVGSINALHIKFQGWTFIATFSTAYQSSNRDPFLLVCYQSSQFMRKHECISRIFGLRLGLGTESSPGQDFTKTRRRSSLATLFDSPFKLGSLFVRLQDVIHWLKGSKFFEVTGALRVSDSERN